MNQYDNSCKTASGKEFEVRYIGASIIGTTNILNMEIIGKTIMEIATVFTNPLETREIFELIGEKTVRKFNNYTNLIDVGVLADSGNITVSLTVPQSQVAE